MLREHTRLATHFVALGFAVGLGLAVSPTASFASTVVVVSPTTMGSWAFVNRGGSGDAITATGSMVNGPATPPLGTGSANLVTPGGTGQDDSELRSSGYDGVALTSIATLGYSTYVTSNSPNNQQFPYLGLVVSADGGATVYDTIFFEPPYQEPSTGNPSLPDQGPTQLGQWQSWDALRGCVVG